MLDQHSDAMARNDTVGRWLLAQPLAYLDTKELESVGSMPKATDYYTPQISLDSLVTMPPIVLQEEQYCLIELNPESFATFGVQFILMR